MFGMGWGELLVLGLVALFVLGPERLPGAIRTVASVARQLRGHLDAAKDQLAAPEFDELREPFEELREPLAELRRPLRDPRPGRRTAAPRADDGARAAKVPGSDVGTGVGDPGR